MSWTTPDPLEGSDVVFDVLRGTRRDDFSGADCLVTEATTPGAVDATVPVAGFYYLVRLENTCGATAGASSTGVPREVTECSTF